MSKPTKPTKKPTNERGLTKNQEIAIEALKAQLGNVSAAFSAAGLDRTMHYEWLQKSEAYKKEVESVQEDIIDIAENSLHRQIIDKNTQATIFFLRTKGRHRGYQDKKEIELTGTISNTLTDEQISEVINRLTK